jgi:hypothetical protein
MGRRELQRIVDDRVFLLGLDQHYRDAMKLFEAVVLLPCAKALAGRLDLPPKDVPIEGYYVESPELTAYFRLMRALQDVKEEEGVAAGGMAELRQILEIAASKLYGEPVFERNEERYLLPAGRDPLSRALLRVQFMPEQWNVPTLLEGAHKAAHEHDDISLVGLAARANDAVVLTALRETVVLYAEKVLLLGGMSEDEPEYVWRVDAALAAAANRFIELFNRLVASVNAGLREKHGMSGQFEFRAFRPIPSAEAKHASHFYSCAEDNEIGGRCVHIATRADTQENYHWAVRSAAGGWQVHDFWSPQMWTTERYRTAPPS